MDFKDGNVTFSIKLVKHLGWFFMEAVVVLSVVIFGLDFFHGLPSPTATANVQDSIAVANSFMVFVTFIVVVGTVAITMGGIYFTKEFTRDKKLILSENLQDLKKEFLDKEEIRNQFLEILLKDKKAIELIDEQLNKLSANRLEDIKQLKTEILKQQKDALQQLEKKFDSKISNLTPKDNELNKLIESFPKGQKK
jgi:hypothetical protein